jgi:ABC-2 type transport system permease protein
VIAQIRAELLKVRSTRTTLGLALGMLALVLLFVVLTGLLGSAHSLSTKEDQRQLFAIGSFAGVFAALAGVLLVTSEYRFGTIRPTFLFTPRRSRVLGAKLIASLLAGLVFGVVGVGLGLAVGSVILSGRGISAVLSGGELALLAGGSLTAIALWGAIGVGVGMIVRNQVGSVIGLLAWAFVVDNLLFGLAPSVGKFMPTQAEDGLVGLTTAHLLPSVAGGAVLVAWAALLAAAGLILAAGRDVN